MPYDKYDKYYNRDAKTMNWKVAAENVVKATKEADESLKEFNKTAEEIHIDYAAAEQQILSNTVEAADGYSKGEKLSMVMDKAVLQQLGEAVKNQQLKFPDPYPEPQPAMCEEVIEEEEVPLDENTLLFMAKRQEEMLVWYPRKNQGGDYSDNTAALEPIHHYNIRDLLARFFIQTHSQWGVIKNWRANCIGASSFYFGPRAMTFAGGAHMPMFDYDGRNVKTQIRKDVKLLQKDFGLGDAWVYETRRGFHIYFFTDIVTRDDYWDMLEKVKCCKGFKRSARGRGYAILRISAKYTDFDIKPLYVLSAESKELKRMTRKAHTIQALIDLGAECGTHFASMFPQWAHFKQDVKEWKPAPKRPSAKRIKKAPKLAKMEESFFKDEAYTGATTATTFTVTTSDNTWINTGNNGGGGGGTSSGF